jgi:signal transduction histidine kinase
VLSAMWEALIIVQFFATLAECAGGSMRWLAAQLTLFIAVAIVLGQTDSRFQAGSGLRTALVSATNWEEALFVVYIIFSGLIRWGALHDCATRRAGSMAERWRYRTLTVVYLALFWAAFAERTVMTHEGANSAVLFNVLISIMLLVLTPLALVHFMSLSRFRAVREHLAIGKAESKQMAAEAASAARREFLRYVFHEVRVPFNSILLGLEELALYPEAVDSRAMMNDIRTMQAAAESMQQVLNDTLDVEKMGSGAYSLELKAISLRETLQRGVQNMQPWARQATVSLAAELSASLPPLVLADPNRLSQVAANFMSNGIKFAPHDGSGIVVLRAFCIPGPSAELESRGGEAAPANGGALHRESGVLPPPAATPLRIASAWCASAAARGDSAIVALHAWAAPAFLGVEYAAAAMRAVALAVPTWCMVSHRAPSRRIGDHDAVAAPQLASPLEVVVETGPPSLPRPLAAPLTSLASHRRRWSDGALSSEGLQAHERGHPSRQRTTARQSGTVARSTRAPSPLQLRAAVALDTATAPSPHAACEGTWIRIEVQDNGCGISAANQARLFGAFVQIDAGALQHSKGTGLGLYICHQIVRRHGGRIGVTSQVGEGALFWAELPVRVLDRAAVHSPPTPPRTVCDDRAGTSGGSPVHAAAPARGPTSVAPGTPSPVHAAAPARGPTAVAPGVPAHSIAREDGVATAAAVASALRGDQRPQPAGCTSSSWTTIARTASSWCARCGATCRMHT